VDPKVGIGHRYFRLYENQISDISPLVESSGLGAGDEV